MTKVRDKIPLNINDNPIKMIETTSIDRCSADE
jgi:hypothetical protein